MNQNELISTMLGMGIIIIIIIIALCIPVIIANWKLFEKAGKPGWASIVPFYSTWILIEIAGLNWWYFLISIGGTLLTLMGIEGLGWLSTIASYFVSFLVYYNIAKKTKQNEILFGILGIFVPYIPVLILGFSKSITYDNDIVVSPNGIFGNNNTFNNVQPQQPQQQIKYCLGCGQQLGQNELFCSNCGKKVE